MKKAITFFLLFFFTVFAVEAQSLLKKLQNKIEEEAVESIFGEEDDKKSQQDNNSDSQNSSNSPKNTKGQGLNSSPADIVATIDEAESSFNNKNYKEARSSIRQAIMDLEIEIGKNILDGLPESIAGLPKIEEEDEVTSTGIGFVGLVIERVYRNNDMEFQIGIGNDAGLLGAASMYAASSAYASSSTSSEENQKKTNFKEHSAVIEFDPDTGYKLTVPFGQSSILVAEGVNFETEDDFMDACSNIDIQKIKNQLGEQ